MEQLKSKDYYILKVRYYGSPYYMKKFNSGDIKAIRNHHNAAKQHNDFFWKFIKKLTGKDQEYFFINFSLVHQIV